MATDTPEANDETPEVPETPAPEATEEAAPVEAAAPEPAASEPAPEPTMASQLDIGSTSVEGVSVEFRPLIRGKIDRFGVAIGTGRRKTSVARVRIKDGSGEFKINGREINEYLPMERDQAMVVAALKATETFGKVDVWVRVNGGGTTGQTGAIVLGVARALQAKQPELHHLLSENGFLTRDDRMVERKKYGLRKARRSFQFSKR
jgi:small subunit ribosomal protein S9